MYKKIVLNNGLKVISHRMSDRQSLSLGIWINVGGRYETPDNKGISHYLEHLLFKGSKKYSCRRIKESIEGKGGSLNGFTAEELTCFLVKMPSRYLGLAADILSDMVLNPSLPALEVKKEKTVILEEIKMYKDQPQSYVYELLDELLWPRQALGAPIIGSEESVSAIGREDLASFKERCYTPANIVVSAAGALDHDVLLREVSKKFAHLPKAERNTFLKAREDQVKPQLKVFDKDTEQTHMAMGFCAFKRDHPLRHASAILHIIMGANMSSRLFNEVREKRGLAYEIGTHIKRLHDTGSFIVHAGTDNQKVTDALTLILKELAKVKTRLVSTDEFRRAKEFYQGQLMLALEDTLDHMFWIGESTATLDRTYSLEEIISEVEKVTRQDVQLAAQTIFTDGNLNLALIGPLKKKEEKLKKYLHIE